ncbi:nuclear transport factor 2 [Basidiobolus meristosporus CBS 931.73]|uniref:Nuclear transport factor 2 n=1 Tax=Basidiobolus meristosporus CBS 931.73 TaxID=1314790 RepID=A0A1Y1WVP7_9FUNG|nr:nuclear transport factor 2 [Basidiobolus meristosporus CBS 931.73]|eukprot:ORX77583.1 nuclear transport factor 2 [Basidiobolus meristosporus CBS 931.73]
MADIQTIAKSFVDFYYSTFDRSRNELSPLYREGSMLTFEGQQFQGSANIVEKLVNLPFQRVQHRVSTLDAQPSHPQQGSLIISVTGQLMIDEESNPQQFTQCFQLVPEGNNYWVLNDVFRLVYG